MLGDLPRDAWHIRGFPRKDVFVIAEEVEERAFLFRRERSTNTYPLSFGAVGVHVDLLRALCWFERPGCCFGVGRFFGNLLPEGGEFFGGNDCGGVIAAFNFALVSALEGGVDGDDSAGGRYLQLKVRIVGNGHELHVTRLSQDGVKIGGNPTTSKVRVSVL